jgi:Arc/MetJ-type ribon-helix-helix transcriptional regulator
MAKSRRLDGKPRSITLTAQMDRDIRTFCRENRIESESEFIRQAIAEYISSFYSDSTLKLLGLKEIKDRLSNLKDMLSVLFSYCHQMHLSLLAYHAPLDDSVKDAAFRSAQARLDKFFEAFQKRLMDDPAFFEKLLHDYVSGSLDG